MICRLKNLLLILSACLAFTTYAQEKDLYVMARVGVNYSMNENTRFVKFGYGLGGAAGVTVGKEFSSLWGGRASLNYDQNRGYATWKSDLLEHKVEFHDVELFVDGTVDLTDWWFPDQKDGVFNLKGFVGIGCLQTFGFDDKVLAVYANYSTDPTLNFGFRGGLSGSFRVGEYSAFVVETTLTCIQDRFNGVVCPTLWDGRLNLSIGYVWFLRHK